MNDYDMFSFLKGFQVKTEAQITNDYVTGKITKDEFIKQMNEIKAKKN